MRKYTNLKQWTFLSLILLSILFLSTLTSSLHNLDSTVLTISEPSVSNWTDSNTTNLYNFTISTNELINKTTIEFNSSFLLDNTTIGTNGPNWTCSNTTATNILITCTSQTANATEEINIWFNTTSPTMTDEIVYFWNITTTDLNGSTNSTNITTGVDGKAPQIEIENTSQNIQLNATSASYIFLTVNVSDANIDTVKLNLSSLGVSYSNKTAMTKNDTNNLYYYNLSGNLALISGLKTLELNLTDKFGNYNNTQYINLTINDITAPSVSLTTIGDLSVNANGTDQLIFTATVTDTELNNVTINLTGLGGAGDQQMYNDGTHGDTNASDNIWTFNMTIDATFKNGTYNIYVNATDNSSNENSSQSLSITVIDVTAPYVIDMNSTLSVVPANGTSTTLTVNVTDLEGIEIDGDSLESVYINLLSIGYSSQQRMYDKGNAFPLSNDSTLNDSIYSWMISIPDTVRSGTYRLNITATDKNNNINNTEYITLNVTDVTIPKAFSVNLSKTQINATGTDTTIITANITDLELDTVYANLSVLGGNATQLLTSAGNNLYTYLLNVSNSINNGTYTIKINATDKSGNYNDSLSIDLAVIDTLAPTIIINSPENTYSYSNSTDLINISTDEDANVTYSIDGGAYISLYNETKDGVADFPQINWIENDSHNITINATDAYGHSTNHTHIFNLRPNLKITGVYLADTSALYTGDTTTINATIATYGFNVSYVNISFYVDGTKLSTQTYIDIFNTTTSPITIESTVAWNVTKGTHYFSANITGTNGTLETITTDNALSNTTFIQDFETNISTDLDFGSIAVAETSTHSVNLTNNAHNNQSAITETITLKKVYNFTNNFTRLETKSFYFALPVNTTTNNITVTLSYNTSLGNITYTQPLANAPGITELIIDANTMNQSSLPVNITVEIGLTESAWISSDFNTTQILENKSSKIFNYNITVPDKIPAGNYIGTLTYSNINNTITKNITFSVNAPELWILSDVVSTPITSSTATYTFYANTESGQKDYSLILKNNNGGTLSNVNMNFSSLNFTNGNENITITIKNGTDGITVTGNNASFGDITANANKSLILTFNVSNHTKSITYSTKFNITTSNGEPIDNYSVTLNLIITDTFDIKMTHPSVEKLYPGNTTTFEMDISYRDGTPVTGMKSSNLTGLAIKNGASQSILSSLNNFTETATPGTYLLNITLPSNMVGGNLKLDTTVTSGNYSATYTQDLDIYAPYLSVPIWTTGKVPENINVYTFTGYDTYGITITNNGLESSGTLTATLTLTTCGTSYLKIFGDAAKTIASIAPGASGTATWTVDPIANKTDCTVTATVTSGKFWFNGTTSSLSKIIDLTTTAPVTPPEEVVAATPTTLISTCDVSACDYDEACVGSVCKFVPCDDGYYSSHKCINYIYSIDFTQIPNLEIVQGNTSTITIKYKNNGTKIIKDFDFILVGLGENSSYKILTTLPDKILDDEPQEIIVLLDISDEAPVGRKNITVTFNSNKLTASTTFVLSILPNAESIQEIDDWMPVLDDDIDKLKKQFEDIENHLNSTNYTLVNNTINQIDILYGELKNATKSGDFLTAYEKKAEIERLIIEANALMDGTILKQGGSFRYILTVLTLLLIAIGAYLLYDQSNPKGYHIFEKGNMAKLIQLRLIPFISPKKSQNNNSSQSGSPNIHSYHHKPVFEVKLLRKIHVLKHKFHLKMDNLHSHQTKLSNERFTGSQDFYAPKPHHNSTYSAYQKKSHVKITPLGASSLSRKTSSMPTAPSKIRHFEISKTRCGMCSKDFKTKYELELHKKYSHK
ncbi:MAG: hypothetical protein K0B07_03890 [DPANN group archaeon]|nr:hypothetical protein [DPANN group archaeon]